MNVSDDCVTTSGHFWTHSPGRADVRECKNCGDVTHVDPIN